MSEKMRNEQRSPSQLYSSCPHLLISAKKARQFENEFIRAENSCERGRDVNGLIKLEVHITHRSSWRVWVRLQTEATGDDAYLRAEACESGGSL